MNAHGVEVLDRANDHEVVGVVAHDLELELFPALDGLLDEDLADGRQVEPSRNGLGELFGVVDDRTTGTPEGERWADDHGEPRVVHDLPGLGNAAREAAARDVEAGPNHGFLEQPAVFTNLHGPTARPDQPNAEPVEHPRLGELDGQIQPGLAADRRKHGIGALLLENGFDGFGRDGSM